MAEQSLQNHAHRPTHTGVAGLFAMGALVLQVMRMRGTDTGGWEIVFVILAVFTLTLISRTYTVRLQDRIIKLEMKVRSASLLTPELQRALLTLDTKQIAALRFASDDELPQLIEQTLRERLAPTEIKKAIRNWVPDLDRT